MNKVIFALGILIGQQTLAEVKSPGTIVLSQCARSVRFTNVDVRFSMSAVTPIKRVCWSKVIDHTGVYLQINDNLYRKIGNSSSLFQLKHLGRVDRQRLIGDENSKIVLQAELSSDVLTISFPGYDLVAENFEQMYNTLRVPPIVKGRP